ncbi:restriction endonuclease subunit S [Nitrosomonas sp. Is37]|uniref:restriction endonuclease subunit S n=1 Tax=Nitrosomonas sp. Is37 TaxID=3080535 RepID=UPI00294B615A|nr:restriction endonuclease subunit S [Nitrosomonas sp. Is37]MDV6344012.1 restriction endonuclease subunit S [Nitrosomonas sp. Is37]
MVPRGWRKGLFEEGIELISGQHVEADLVNTVGIGRPYLTGPADFLNGKIIVTKYTESGKKFSKKGDLLITVKGSGTGKVVESDGAYAISRQLMAIRPTRFYVRFTYYNLLARIARYEEAAAGLIPGISRDDVLHTPLLIPPLPEQKKIAQILFTWDKAITTTEQLLANSRQQKKALMQQLLTGKKRFDRSSGTYGFQKTRYGEIPSDWSYLAIKEVCTEISEKNSTGRNYPVLSCSKHEGFVDSLKYFKKQVYSEDTSSYKVIPHGCFGFPANHIEEGSIGLQTFYDVGIISPIYVVFRADSRKVNNDYLFAIFKTEHYRQIFSAATNASVDRRGSLRWKEFSAIHLPLPPLEEQNRITRILKSADQEIDALQQKLDCLKQEKKALMQQLLTGKRRVKVNGLAT